MTPQQTPPQEVIAAIKAAAMEDKHRPFDILLQFREAVIDYEKSGHHGIGLWNIFRSKCGLTCTYGTFAGALTKFRKRFGLPPPGQRNDVKIQASLRASQSAQGSVVPGVVAPQNPPEAPRRSRIVASNIVLPPSTASALHQISVAKMHAATPLSTEADK